MKCLIRWYCGRCKKEYTIWTDNLATRKCECPKCKKNTEYDNIFELETLQVG